MILCGCLDMEVLSGSRHLHTSKKELDSLKVGEDGFGKDLLTIVVFRCVSRDGAFGAYCCKGKPGRVVTLLPESDVRARFVDHQL